MTNENTEQPSSTGENPDLTFSHGVGGLGETYTDEELKRAVYNDLMCIIDINTEVKDLIKALDLYIEHVEAKFIYKGGVPS